MKIVQLKLWQLPLTSHDTYYMADGKTCDTVTSMVLQIVTDNGLSGWGEVCPIPHYLPAYAAGVKPALQELSPVLLGANPIGPEALMAKLDHHLPGHPYAKSIIDIAVWDLTAKQADLPLYALLGGRQQNSLPIYHSITCVAPETMAKMAQQAQANGVTQFQVKLGSDNHWETDVARLRLVREAVASSALVYGDWNCGASRLDAIRVGRAVRNLDIMLEQPCKTLEDCAAVRSATGLPVKIDENCFDIASLLQASNMQCLDAVAIKLSKFGGLSAARRARDLCLHLGAKMCIEDTWGSDITTAAALHLGAATAAASLLNVCDLSGYVSPRIDPSAPQRINGKISPPDGAGLGISPDLDLLGKPLAIFQ